MRKVQVSNLQENYPLISIFDLNKFYYLGENALQVLNKVTFNIYEGEFISIMGPSGSGKSTLINIIGLLDHNFEGQYFLNGKSIDNHTDNEISSLRNQMVGFIFQDFNLIETMTVKENVRLPLLYSGARVRETETLVLEALKKVGLDGKENNQVHELSGGQKQRVAIARALINRPKFIIADELTGSLDTKTSKTIMDILAKLHKEEGVTVVMVTHDPSLQRYADRHLIIIDGMLREGNAMDAESLTREFNRTYEEKK